MKEPLILKEESIAVIHASSVSYTLIYKLSHGWVAYEDSSGLINGKFDAALPPEHIFDADLLGDSLDDVDEAIREELRELTLVCNEAGCRYFQFLFDDYEIVKDEDE